jgi:hypothetical protein
MKVLKQLLRTKGFICADREIPLKIIKDLNRGLSGRPVRQTAF